ncbi:MAG: Sec-independent protein translocase protein TatB [Pseudohongiellaceae bacterium]|jgi:sec-independent protein translocase protein TatB
MTGVGFFEILLIGVVGLLILGPDKLPGALRTMALWIGRFRRSFDDIKRDIEKEIGADEIRRQLRNEAIMDKFQEGKKQITDTVESAKKQTNSLKSNLDLKQQILNSGKTQSESSPENSNPVTPAPETSTSENMTPAPSPEDAEKSQESKD